MNAAASSAAGLSPERQPHPSPHRDRVNHGLVWFGLLGAPIAWVLQELISTSLTSLSCYPRDVPLSAPLSPDLTSHTFAISGIALAISIAAWIAAFASWRRSRDEKPGGAQQLLGSGDGRTRFMSMSGMLVSGLFLLVVIITTLEIAFVPNCGG